MNSNPEQQSAHYSDEASQQESGDYDEVKVNIKKIELIAKQCDRVFLKVLLFFGVFLFGFAYGLEGTIRGVCQTNAASAFNEHSLGATVNVIRTAIGAGCQFAYARLSDNFGRLQLIVTSILFTVVGNIVTSQSTNIAYFCGGTAIYQIGLSGMQLCAQFIAMDYSNFNWRLFCASVPNIGVVITTWVSGNITSELGQRWGWGIGMWAFILPLSCLPLLAVLLYFEWRARCSSQWKELNQKYNAYSKIEYRDVSVMSSIWIRFVRLFHRLNVIGILFTIVIYGLILVPITLAGGDSSQWGTAKILAPFIIGFGLIPFFLVWEIKLAKAPLIPLELLKDRAVWAALVIGVFVNIVYYVPNDYMYTVLLVAVNESVTSATRMISLYSFVSSITAFFVGLFVVRYRHMKPLIVFGCSIWFVANGLLVRYRSGEEAHGGLVGALVLVGFSAGFINYTTLIAVQSYAPYEYMSSITAGYLSLWNFGLSVGSAISGAIWTQTLYQRLLKEIGDSQIAKAAYSSPIGFIMEHPWGTPIRTRMVSAYNHIQWLLSVAGLCCVVPMFLAAFLLRDRYLDSKQSLDPDDSSGHSYFPEKVKAFVFDRSVSPSSDDRSHTGCDLESNMSKK